MTVINQKSNTVLTSFIKHVIDADTLYLLLLKDKLPGGVTNPSLNHWQHVYQDQPSVLMIQKVSDANSKVFLAYDGEDPEDYDVTYIDNSEAPAVQRYLKFVDINNPTQFPSLTWSHSEKTQWWLYVSVVMDWSQVPDSVVAPSETTYETVMLADLYGETAEYLTELPQNGIIYNYEFSDTPGVNYNFSKFSGFKYIHKFFIKLEV